MVNGNNPDDVIIINGKRRVQYNCNNSGLCIIYSWNNDCIEDK